MSQQPRAGKWATMAVVASGVFMATLDASIVNVSLPTFIDELDAPFVAVQWVVLGYLLVITGLLLPAGRASEILGRKRLFLWGFAVFTLGSLLAGFAGNVWALVAFRIVQAVGGAAMQAISPALVMEVFPARERGRALGLVLSAVSLGLVAGPVVGGLILGSLGWPFIFFINVPVGVAGTLLGWRVLPDSPPTGRASFDWYGTVALVAGLALMLLGLNGVQTFGLVSPFVLGTLGGAIVVLVAFVWWQRRGPSPIVHLELFRVREFSAAALAAFLSFIGVAAQILLLPFYLQLVLRLPVPQVGLILAVVPALMGVIGPVAGTLADRYGPRVIASSGLVLSGAGLGSLATLDAGSGVLDVVLRLAISGAGFGLFNSANGSSMMGAAPPRFRGQAGAMMALARNMAQSWGQALWGTYWATLVVVLTGAASPQAAAPAEMVDAFRIAFGTASVVVVLAFVVSTVRGRSPHHTQEGAAAGHAGGGAPASGAVRPPASSSPREPRSPTQYR